MKDINDDIWTCSQKFREDIKDFFADKPKFALAEIGSYKGYTTGFFSDIFKKVIAVDYDQELHDFSRKLNSDKNNIEYILLDLYKDSWNTIPEDPDVVFIDAIHQYESCKSDVINTLDRFKNLKYIIFDDWGVWPGVRTVVDEFIERGAFLHETYIGLTNVPRLGRRGGTRIKRNTHEGVIVKNLSVIMPE